jgi:hypothetical protein
MYIIFDLETLFRVKYVNKFIYFFFFAVHNFTCPDLTIHYSELSKWKEKEIFANLTSDSFNNTYYKI